jgi:hypothetical protein
VKRFIAAVLASSLLFSGCGVSFSRNDTATTIQKFPAEIVEDVARLPILDISSVDNYQKYTKFADFANTLIKILNEKGDGTFKIPEIEATHN